MNLMTLAYDFPSPLSLEDQHGLPCPEPLWRAETEEEWRRHLSASSVSNWPSAEAVVRRLGDSVLPTPSKIGMFACHVVISTLLQKILLFRRSCPSADYGYLETRQRYIRALKRWQHMWETEPESSLSPDHPRGPILFNCTAILRVAYVRLVADYAPVRYAFSFRSPLSGIEASIKQMDDPVRDGPTTRAALQACLALRIPVHLGFEVVARTSFWIWSVQHALCYFECSLLLAQWLQIVEKANDLSDDEATILSLARDLVLSSQSDELGGIEQPLAAGVLRNWARLLDTGDTTVWQIMPKMAHALRQHADSLAPM